MKCCEPKHNPITVEQNMQDYGLRSREDLNKRKKWINNIHVEV